MKLDLPQAIVLAAALAFCGVVVFKDPTQLMTVAVPMLTALVTAFRGAVVSKDALPSSDK